MCRVDRLTYFHDSDKSHGIMLTIFVEWCPSCEYHEVLNAE